MKRLFCIAYFFVERMLVERCVPRLPIVVALADGHIERGSAFVRVTHSCGHLRWRRELGNKNERENKVGLFQKLPCPNCSMNRALSK